MDALVERLSRIVAQRTSRRSFLAHLSRGLLGAAIIPLLPVSRVVGDAGAFDFGDNKPASDPESCNYWRHCALDGIPCGQCGGSNSECPPGTIMSPTSWVGTCMDPTDQKEYIIGYRDCCGKEGCYRTLCYNNKDSLPTYRITADNAVFWCFGTNSGWQVNCTTAVKLGVKA